MSSTTVTASPEVAASFDALDAAITAIAALDLDALTSAQRLRALQRLETATRRQTVTGHDLITSLADEPAAQIGGPVHKVIGDWLRISYPDARRRLRHAAQLAPRHSLTGQPLAAELPATAGHWRAGLLDSAHVHVIATFMTDLPEATPPEMVEQAEKFLAQQAALLRPDQLQKLADRYALTLNPDGNFTEEDRARQRGFTWTGQRVDGMSIGRLTATPELRATLDAWLAKFAAPGMCNPVDHTPTTSGEPDHDAANRDNRSYAQRQHDALTALARAPLGDHTLGKHNGLPVSVIVTTTLQQLHNAAGIGLTTTGTVLPITDIIRMASHAYHYLAAFDENTGRALYLGRTKRIASPDQRIVLYAKDRGCTHPGCDAPGYLTEVHHIHPWAHGGPTNITNTTLACPAHHKLLDHGWTIHIHPNGDTQWIPPPPLDHGQPRTNTYHHPEKYLPADNPNDHDPPAPSP